MPTIAKETKTEYQRQKAVQTNTIYKIKIQRVKLTKTKVLQALSCDWSKAACRRIKKFLFESIRAQGELETPETVNNNQQIVWEEQEYFN